MKVRTFPTDIVAMFGDQASNAVKTQINRQQLPRKIKTLFCRITIIENTVYGYAWPTIANNR